MAWASLLATALAGCGDAGTVLATEDGPDATAASPDAASSGSNPDAGADTGPPLTTSVLQFHGRASRDGLYVDPLLTPARAAAMHRDPAFRSAPIDGSVYAQPLYVEASPVGPLFLVVTEKNNVYALDETGAQKWTRALGTPASGPDACGNIFPLGITGTPVVDPTRMALYLDAAVPAAGTTKLREHVLHALSLRDGTELAGWPLRASTVSGVIGSGSGTMRFVPNMENQRGALLLAGDTLYVPYGGHSGDCGDYRGWILGVPLDHPSAAQGWVTESRQAGIWATGGLAYDGQNVFAATANAGAGQSCPNPPPTSPPPGWLQQEAILRLQAGPIWSGSETDYWAPDDWPCLDNADLDVGGSNPIPVDVPASSPSHLVVALGKDGKMYVADRTNLGGVGPGVGSLRIADGEIKTSPVTYSTSKGTYVAFYTDATAVGCPPGQGGNLVGVRFAPGSPPVPSIAWCADEKGQGSPIVTTDGQGHFLVWAVGGDFSNRLGAWDGETGAVVFAGGGVADVAAGFHHFSTILAVKGRIFVGAGNENTDAPTKVPGVLYAYTAP